MLYDFKGLPPVGMNSKLSSACRRGAGWRHCACIQMGVNGMPSDCLYWSGPLFSVWLWKTESTQNSCFPLSQIFQVLGWPGYPMRDSDVELQTVVNGQLHVMCTARRHVQAKARGQSKDSACKVAMQNKWKCSCHSLTQHTHWHSSDSHDDCIMMIMDHLRNSHGWPIFGRFWFTLTLPLIGD
jgi:hypothetical protein